MMELVLVSNDIDLTTRAIDAGVERCLVDLELLGKSERQTGRGTFITHHSMSDVERMRGVLPMGALEVRIDRLNSHSAEQIDRVIDAGADIVMLPMVESAQEALDVIELIGGRARLCLLVETVIGLFALPELIVIPGVDEVHIGLNDLMISSGGDHLFRPLASGMLDDPARLVRSAELGLGIGGITAPGTSGLPVDPDRLIGEMVRLDVT
ncbi:MAG: aldolase/citrate lyase family protein, partial [Ilumatobacteraceae bacterium]